MKNQTNSVGRLTKTKQQQMFNGYYDTLSNYFGGDVITNILEEKKGELSSSVSFMKGCVSQLEKITNDGYWAVITNEGVISL
jgi:hypothetical protein